MTPACDAPLSDLALLDYWARDGADDQATEHLEEHLFACRACSARLQALAALGIGVVALVRQGRVSGIVSRAALNRMQRDGLRVRQYSLSPGDTVPCCVFPGDDLVVTALRADLSGVEAVSLSVVGADGTVFARLDDVPVSEPAGEVFWVTPAAIVRQLPTLRLQLTLAPAGAAGTTLGSYVLEHSASLP